MQDFFTNDFNKLILLPIFLLMVKHELSIAYKSITVWRCLKKIWKDETKPKKFKRLIGNKWVSAELIGIRLRIPLIKKGGIVIQYEDGCEQYVNLRKWEDMEIKWEK